MSKLTSSRAKWKQGPVYETFISLIVDILVAQVPGVYYRGKWTANGWIRNHQLHSLYCDWSNQYIHRAVRDIKVESIPEGIQCPCVFKPIVEEQSNERPKDIPF